MGQVLGYEGEEEETAEAEDAAGAEASCASGLFRHEELLEELQDPEQRQLMHRMMRAFEGPELTDEEDGRGLYHDARCLLRYLRARRWDFEAAHEMLRGTGRWRRSFDFAGLLEGRYADTVLRENSSGKMYVRGYDRRGRVIVYLKARNEHSEDNRGSVQHLVYCLERAIQCIDRRADEGRLQCKLSDPDAGKLVLLLDFSDCSLSNIVPLSVVSETVTILQDHYPERLGQAFVVDTPWILNLFVGAVWPFLDPATQEKVQFVHEVGEERSARLQKYFDLAVLEPEFGGTATQPFQSHIFLGCKQGGTEFGLDFSEQVELSRDQEQGGAPDGPAASAATRRHAGQSGCCHGGVGALLRQARDRAVHGAKSGS